MIATDEIQYTINRCGLVVNNSSSEEEKFIAVQTVQALQQVLQGIKQLEGHPKLKQMASDFFKDEVNNDT
jgi:hypothetical protein